MSKHFFKVLVLSLLVLASQRTNAQVKTNIGGSSDGESLVGAAGPIGINKRIQISKQGGSIASASAKSSFTKTKITHGNKVVSKGTGGDAELTHVDANSIFAGTATFISKDGNPVENFTIDIGLSGTLKCKTADPDIPEFFSLAQVSSDVIVDGDLKFSALATQDGAGRFSASEDVSTSDFTTGANTATIKKTFPINLGTLTDGQKLAFFFAGSTLVSYGADVPISFCSADFFNTDTFAPAKKQAGKFIIGAATKSVTVDFDDVLFIETEDESLLDDIKTIRVIISAGAGVFEVSAGAIGDIDADGISDVVLSASNQSSLLSAIQNSSNNTLFVFGVTNNDEVFTGILDLSSI